MASRNHGHLRTHRRSLKFLVWEHPILFSLAYAFSSEIVGIVPHDSRLEIVGYRPTKISFSLGETRILMLRQASSGATSTSAGMCRAPGAKARLLPSSACHISWTTKRKPSGPSGLTQPAIRGKRSHDTRVNSSTLLVAAPGTCHPFGGAHMGGGRGGRHIHHAWSVPSPIGRSCSQSSMCLRRLGPRLSASRGI